MRKNGRLVIKYAKDNHAKAVYARRIEKLTKKNSGNSMKKKEKLFKAIRWDWERQREIYMSKLW